MLPRKNQNVMLNNVKHLAQIVRLVTLAEWARCFTLFSMTFVVVKPGSAS
jgi:hypothetical protein